VVVNIGLRMVTSPMTPTVPICVQSSGVTLYIVVICMHVMINFICCRETCGMCSIMPTGLYTKSDV